MCIFRYRHDPFHIYHIVNKVSLPIVIWLSVNTKEARWGGGGGAEASQAVVATVVHFQFKAMVGHDE
jgi:hypothetical protein